MTRAISLTTTMCQHYAYKGWVLLMFIATILSKILRNKIRPGGWDGRIQLQYRRPGFNPWVGKIPWRRKWQPTPVCLPGEFLEQRKLVGYSPWGHNESDRTEWHTFTLTFKIRPDLTLFGNSFPCLFLYFQRYKYHWSLSRRIDPYISSDLITFIQHRNVVFINFSDLFIQPQKTLFLHIFKPVNIPMALSCLV